MSADGADAAEFAFAEEGGDTAAPGRSADWPPTLLGPPGSWSSSLKTIVGMVSANRFPQLLWWGPDHIAIYNDACAALLGARHPRALGKPLREVWPEETQFAAKIAAVFEGGAPSWIEDARLDGRSSDEQTRFGFACSPVADDCAPGGIGGVLCTLIELGDAPAASARREERERLEALSVALSMGTVGVFEWELGSDRVTVFGPLASAYGLDAAAAEKGLPFDAFMPGIHPEDRPRLSAALSAATEEGRPLDIEYRAIGGGEERIVRVRGETRTRSDGGQVLTGSIRDVTEDRIARRLLQKHQAALEALNAQLEQRVAAEVAERRLLADIVEGTDALVLVADTDYRWLAINHAASDEFERVYGVRPEPGDSMFDMPEGPGDRQSGMRALWTRAMGGEEFSTVARLEDPHGHGCMYELKFNVLRDGAGRQIGAYQFVYNVTDRIREQERLAQAEEQLRQAQKMEAMGQLTGGVAHDFNNLLTPIIGALDMLQRSAIGGERERRLIGGAFQSADRARTLVQRLLAFARRQPLQPTGVDVGAVVVGMTDLLASTTGPQVRIAVDIAPDLKPAKVDQNQLEMALLNLCVNARDAMPGGGMIRISAHNAEVLPGERPDLKPGRYVRLSVADTGAGMHPDVLARAVEPFFSTKGIGKGTGLGLSMVHGLMHQLGGAMTLQSRLGVGTNVELWAPQCETALPDAAPSADAKEDTQSGRGLALLVDDEELVRLSTAAMLSELGYSVREAGSAEEAISLVAQGLKPDLVVTDHLMPGMTGADLAHAVHGRSAATPVLIISGYADAEGIDPSLPRLTKPFVNAELAAAIAALR
jgi:signal transduction histidine kinase